MDLIVLPSTQLKGTLLVPGDKSISHRALICGALARGATLIHNFLNSEDCLNTLKVLQQLGVEIDYCLENPTFVKLKRDKFIHSTHLPILNFGNAGTGIRLMAGVLAGANLSCILNGDASLQSRPMKRITAPLREMGANIQGTILENEEVAPIILLSTDSTTLPLKAITYKASVASAQVKSCLLLAALKADGETVYIESTKTRDHTERMLKDFGVKLLMNKNNNKGGTEIRMMGGQVLDARNVFIPGDISSAAFFMVGASILQEADIVLEQVGLNPTRTGIIAVLQQMGANIEIINSSYSIINNEPRADVRVVGPKKRLQAITISPSLIPNIIDE